MRRPGRKTLITLTVIATLLVAGGMFLFVRFGSEQSRAERWVQRQVLAIIEANLNPEVTFTDFRFTWPDMLSIRDFALVADGHSIITVAGVQVTLAERPRRGTPIRIARVAFDRPVVRLIVGADGALVGLTDMVRNEGGETTADGGSTSLSDVLQIEQIALKDGAIRYEPHAAPPMVLGPLTFDLESTHDPDKPLVDNGWYAFSAKCTVEPVVDLSTNARLNINTLDIEFSPLTLHTELTRDQYQVFTPDLQNLLARYSVTGTLDGRLSGLIPLDDIAATDLEWAVTLTDAGMTAGGQDLPITVLDLVGSYRNSVLDLPVMRGHLLRGRASASARVDYNLAGGPFTVDVSGTGLRINDLIQVEDGQATNNFGRADGTVHVEGRSAEMPQSLSGHGEGKASEARIALVDLMSTVLKTGAEDEAGNDRAAVSFTIHGDRVHFDRLDIVGRLIAIDGEGDFFFDQRLNLLVNAGPVERLNEALGPIGDVLSKLTGVFVLYQITGTTSEPEVAVRPLSIGTTRSDPSSSGSPQAATGDSGD